MGWPSGGTSGWEAFGTPITSDPEEWPLPIPRRSYYFDPTRLGGVGFVLTDSVTLGYHGGTVVVRRRLSSVEAEWVLPYVWSDALLDAMVVEDFDPCAVVLDVYDDDRETILWSVGTSERHPRPWLLEPERYAEQEIDPAAGAATLGTITLTIVDKSQTAGDQDSGWVTSKLAEAGIANLAGRRCRVRRFVDPEPTYYVLADGPASAPRLDNYAAFTFDVRDTRETERKVRLFDAGIEQVLLPEGLITGYGSDGAGGWLVPPSPVLLGTWNRTNLWSPSAPYTIGYVDLTASPGNSSDLRTMTIEAYLQVSIYGGLNAPLDPTAARPVWSRWRAAGSSDPWVEGRLDIQVGLNPVAPAPSTPRARPYPDRGGSYAELIVTGVTLNIEIQGVFLGAWSADTALVPADGQAIELQILGPRGVPPTPEHPLYLDGITAGEFARNVYAGVYSPPESDGTPRPTGIRYDEAALLAITTPIRLRVTEPIEDARDWLEKNIYGPTGYVPAIDDLGVLSPLSQIPPDSAAGLLAVDDAITEPSSDWSAGERIINVVQMRYQRDYIPDPGDPNPPRRPRARPYPDTNPVDAEDGLAIRDVLVEFVDPVSVERYGRQVMEYSGEAFRAVGTPTGEPLTDTESEAAYILAQARQMYVQERYAFGAPAISVAVMRRYTPGLRAGSWVVVDLSWLPDYITQRRGLVGLGQIVALGDLDCAWRQLLIEMVTPLSLPGS